MTTIGSTHRDAAWYRRFHEQEVTREHREGYEGVGVIAR